MGPRSDSLWSHGARMDPTTRRMVEARERVLRKKKKGASRFPGLELGRGRRMDWSKEWGPKMEGHPRGEEEGVSISPTPVFLRLGHQWPGGYAG